MERNVMGELSMHRAAGTKPSFSDIARRHGLDRHTVAKYWREGGEAGGRRSDRESAFERVRPIVEAKAVLPGATKKGVHEMLLHLHNDPPAAGLRGVHRVVPQAGGRLRLPLPRRRTRASRRRRAASCSSTGRRTSGSPTRTARSSSSTCGRARSGTPAGTASYPRGRGPRTTCSRACLNLNLPHSR